jgi:hypothetical protein
MTTETNLLETIAETLVESHNPQIAELREQLKSGVVEIIFTKVDGTERVMIATLNHDLIPPAPEPKEGETPKPKRKQNPDVMPVYDLENEGWRSFKIENFKSSRVLDGYVKQDKK